MMDEEWDDPSALTDEALLAACAAGCEESLGRLLKRYEAPLGRFLYRLLNCREDAEETLYATFLSVWNAAATFRSQSTAKVWIYRIATHHACDRLRKRQRTVASVRLPTEDTDETLPSDAPAIETVVLDTLERRERWSAVAAALEEASPGDRLLLVLFYLEEHSYSEISELTGLSVATVKRRLHRARGRLNGRIASAEKRQKQREQNEMRASAMPARRLA
jgi:RNA polymerase sigma-70 factor, ECF subfamily